MGARGQHAHCDRPLLGLRRQGKERAGLQLLKARLRKAEASNRQGISFSGVDIIIEVASLLSDCNIGEIKLNSKESKAVAFKIGVPIDESWSLECQNAKCFEVIK